MLLNFLKSFLCHAPTVTDHYVCGRRIMTGRITDFYPHGHKDHGNGTIIILDTGREVFVDMPTDYVEARIEQGHKFI